MKGRVGVLSRDLMVIRLANEGPSLAPDPCTSPSILESCKVETHRLGKSRLF